MPTPYAPGHFVWHELQTTDLEGAKSFYSALFDWTMEDRDMGDAGIYTMFNSGKDGVGGMMVLPGKFNTTSYWGVYISVEDVDAAAKKASSIGGEVFVAPFDIPGSGRAALLKDPAGGFFYVFSAKEPYDMPDQRPGLVGWNELMSTEVAKANAFYGELINWNLDSREMGDQGTYWLYKRGDDMAAGAMQMPPDVPAPSHWMPYFGVSDVPATIAKAQELGGHVLVPATKMDDMGVHFAALSSPDGAAFGILEL